MTLHRYAAIVLLLVACDSSTDPAGPVTPDTGGSGTSGPDATSEAEPLDLRVTPPAPEPDKYVDLVSPEAIIPAGEERMYCWFVRNDQGELAIRNVDATQGKYGHHVVLLRALKEEPDGTFRDCSDNAEMGNFRAFALPDTELPEGHAILIPDKMQYVFQLHYVNADTQPIKVRDVARLVKVDPAKVTHWVTTLTTNSLTFDVPPGAEPQTLSFDCPIDEDLDVLVLGGHMHEWGTAFEIMEVPPAGDERSLYYVDPWKVEYRDSPPVSLFFTKPLHIVKGTKLRTSCTWLNDGEATLGFPGEMCAAFGYVVGPKAPIHCESL